MLLLPREVFMERKNNIIIDSIREEREYQGLFDAAIRESKVIKPQPIAVTGLCEGARTALLTSLASDYRAQSGVGALVIVPDEREGIASAIRLWRFRMPRCCISISRLCVS